jgi:PTH1 family peptidyl-tRNA hydrolase
MKLIVGLGNPGVKYKNTRHNIGFIILDNYVQDNKWIQDKDALIVTTLIDGNKVLFVKPQTYMNLSGRCVARLVKYYKILPEDILVIHDDLDLPKLKYRVKYNSSSGGHNGINDIINALGTKAFTRLKIGIGHEPYEDIKDYVLGKLSKDELTLLKNDIFNSLITDFINKDSNYIMNKYNQKG